MGLVLERVPFEGRVPEFGAIRVVAERHLSRPLELKVLSATSASLEAGRDDVELSLHSNQVHVSAFPGSRAMQAVLLGLRELGGAWEPPVALPQRWWERLLGTRRYAASSTRSN